MQNKIYGDNWRRCHKKEIKQYSKKYYKLNKEKLSIYSNKFHKKYNKNRRHIDINFKILGNLRCRIYKALKGFDKSDYTQKLIGCSIEYLKQYLEKQFRAGMTWKNYGKWHIDHIKPCARFDLSKPSQQRKCFHYTNLQPLWAEDNFRKRYYL
ncbi:MAG: hypothetical protein V1901_03950 [Patescibacteria group bacterium]